MAEVACAPAATNTATLAIFIVENMAERKKASTFASKASNVQELFKQPAAKWWSKGKKVRE